MGVKVVRPTYLDKKTGKRCKLDYYVQVCAGGERYLRRVGTRDAAYEKKAEIEEEMKKGTHTMPEPDPVPASEKITFKKFAETWMTGTVAKNLKKKTQMYYTGMLKRIPDDVQDRPFDEITRDDVQKVVYATIDAGLARSTALGIIRTISSIYGYAADAGVYLGANVAAKPSRILRQDDGSVPVEGDEDDDDDQIDCLDGDETDRLLDVVEKNHHAYFPIYLFALRTAARQGEQIGIAWKDINWDGRYVTIRRTIVEGQEQSTKNRKKRRVPLTPQLVGVLKAHQRAQIKKAEEKGQKASPWVFTNTVGGFVDPAKLRKVHVWALKEAGLRYVEYRSLRNSGLTIMAESGVPQTSLQRIAGHSDFNVTARFYLKVKPEAHKATLDAMAKMDSVWNANGDANESGNDVLLSKT